MQWFSHKAQYLCLPCANLATTDLTVNSDKCSLWCSPSFFRSGLTVAPKKKKNSRLMYVFHPFTFVINSNDVINNREKG